MEEWYFILILALTMLTAAEQKQNRNRTESLTHEDELFHSENNS